MAQKKYVSLSKLESFLDNLKNLFATKTEVDAKADSIHSHDDVYYTETEVDEKLATLDDRIVAEDDGTLTTELPETFGGRTANEYALKSDLENVSWNDLTDKPFGVEMGKAEIAWDGNTSGRDNADTMYYKVSDMVLTKDQLAGLTAVIYVSGEDTPVLMNDDNLVVNEDSVQLYFDETPWVIVCSKAGEGFTVGTWFLKYTPDIYVKNLEYLAEVVKPIDPKYLPEGSGGVTSWNDLTDKPFDEQGVIMQEALPNGYPSVNREVVTLLSETDVVPYEDNEQIWCHTIEDSGFFFALGETYVVNFNDTIYECTVNEDEECIGNLSKLFGIGDTGEPFVIWPDCILTFTSDVYNIELTGPVIEYTTIDLEYLPVIPDYKLDKHGWNKHYGTIPDSMLPEKALLWKKKAENKLSCVLLTNDGIDLSVSFMQNGMTYCLVTSDIFELDTEKTYCTRRQLPERVQSLVGTPEVGTNCATVGYVIVVYEAGSCTTSEGKSFQAPQAGTYFQRISDTSYAIDLGEVLTGVALETTASGCVVNSSTTGSTKRFAITVDDDGVIKAAEVVDVTS
jgi:hypothetical protein